MCSLAFFASVLGYNLLVDLMFFNCLCCLTVYGQFSVFCSFLLNRLYYCKFQVVLLDGALMIYMPALYTSLLDCMHIVGTKKEVKYIGEYKLLLFVFDI